MSQQKLPGLEIPLPPGFSLMPDFLSTSEESRLLDYIATVEFGSVRMHGVTAKRRTRQFGWHYAFESHRVTLAEAIPDCFGDMAARSAALAGINTSEWEEALLNEYPSGSGIGWHLDAPAFGIIAGISLLGRCRMRFQTGIGADRMTSAVELPARSIYLLTGAARTEWQHSIPPVREPRYSITFRTLRNQKVHALPDRVVVPCDQSEKHE